MVLELKHITQIMECLNHTNGYWNAGDANSILPLLEYRHIIQMEKRKGGSGSTVNVNPKHWAPFGCPAYVLTDAMQDNKQIQNKWKPRSRVGIYLGRSPMHGRNVALVLNNATGLVSAQFHVDFDESFQTLDNKNKLEHPWLSLAGFTQYQKLKAKSGELKTYKLGATTDSSSEGGVRKRKRAKALDRPVDVRSRLSPKAAKLQHHNKQNTKKYKRKQNKC